MIQISSKYLIAVIFFISLYIFCKKETIEKMDCLISLNDLERYSYRQYITKKFENIGLNSDQITALYNGVFEKRRKISDYKITLKSFLSSEYIYDKNKKNDNIIKLIQELINENRLHNPYYDYIIIGDTPIANIKNTIITKDMKNRLICGLKNMTNIENFMEELSYFLFSFRDIPCNAPRFLNWCNDKLKKKDPVANYALSRIPLNMVINNFNPEKIGGSYLLNHIKQVETSDKISFSIKNYKHILPLLKQIIGDLKETIKKFKAIPKENKTEKISMIKVLKPKINIFYELKAHYKLLRIYTYINSKVPVSDFKDKAMSCCGKFEYPYKCYNFSNKKSAADAGIFGFEKYGFVKESGCKGKTLVDEYNTENILITSFFEKKNNFTSMSETNKKRFYDEIKSFFISHNVRISGEIQGMVLNRIKDKAGNRLDELNGFFAKEVDSIPNYSKEKYAFDIKDKKLLEEKKTIFGSNNYVLIQKMLEKQFNFTDNDYYLDPDFELDNKKSLLDVYINNFNVLHNLYFYANNILKLENNDSIEFSYSCLGIKNGGMKYSELFKNYYLPLRFQNIIMVQIGDIISKLKDVVISENKFDIDNIINKMIESNKVLPSKRIIYPCKKRDIVLQDLRDLKMISYLDLKNYKEKFNQLCKDN
jgi:hypothetical protein